MIVAKKYSSCCGASPTSNGDADTADLGFCPDCKEHCEYEKEELELVTVEFEKELFERIIKAFKLSIFDYNVKKVEIKDEFFKDDQMYRILKQASTKAYKDLKKYEFDERNK